MENLNKIELSDEQLDLVYSHYKLGLKNSHIDLENILTEEEFKEIFVPSIINVIHIKEEDKNDFKLGYVPSLPGDGFTRSSTYSQINEFRNVVERGLSTLNMITGNSAPADITENLVYRTAKLIQDAGFAKNLGILGYAAKSISSQRAGKGNGSPPSKGNPVPPTSGGESYVNFSFNPRPLQLSFNTGIKPNSFAEYFIEARQDSAPLHISTSQFRINPTSDVYTRYFSNKIALSFQSAIQSRVSFTVNLSNISATKLCTYFNNLAIALSNYYWHASILSYCSVPGNRNFGMWSLRNQLTADNLNNLSILENALRNVPIPPNLNTLIFWMNQTFRSSSNPGSSLLKISPVPFVANSSGHYYSQTDIYASYQNLMSSDTRTTIAMLASAFPEWTNHSSSELLHPIQAPVHDDEFLNLWANLPFVQPVTDSDVIYGPIPDLKGNITYSSYSDFPDGGVLGLTSVYNVYGLYEPNLLGIVTDTNTSNLADTCSRFTFAYRSGEGRFINPYSSGDWTSRRERGETYVIDADGEVHNSVAFGAAYCNDISALSLLNDAQQLLDWIFNINGLQSGGSSDSSSRKGNSKRRFKR